jgi:acyl dehydratase
MTPPAAPQPLVVGPLTVTDFVRYQGASGDMNPLHHDPQTAAVAGFETPISPGMLQAGLLGSYAATWFGAEHVRGLRVRFDRPVAVGDTLTCTGALTAPAAGDVTAELRCVRQDGELVARAWVTAAPDPGPEEERS